MKQFPLHPMLVHFPIACWGLSTMLDISSIVGNVEIIKMLAMYLNGFALIFLLPVLLAGALELKFENWDDVKAVSVLEKHVVLVLTASILYGSSFYWKLKFSSEINYCSPSLYLSIIGFMVLMIGAHYGGTLVYRYGIGQRKNSN